MRGRREAKFQTPREARGSISSPDMQTRGVAEPAEGRRPPPGHASERAIAVVETGATRRSNGRQEP